MIPNGDKLNIGKVVGEGGVNAAKGKTNGRPSLFLARNTTEVLLFDNGKE